MRGSYLKIAILVPFFLLQFVICVLLQVLIILLHTTFSSRLLENKVHASRCFIELSTDPLTVRLLNLFVDPPPHKCGVPSTCELGR